LFCAADLDDTLYPLSTGIAKACGQNIKGESLFANSVLGNVFTLYGCCWHEWYHWSRLHGGKAWHREKQNWWFVQPPLQELWNNYGWFKGMIKFLFLAHNWKWLLNSEIFDNLCLFCFIVNAGNWIWLWLWWISQVHDLFSVCVFDIFACFVVVILIFKLLLLQFCSWKITLWELETRPSSEEPFAEPAL